MKNNCIVVIPIYKNNPSPCEKKSFKQCLTVLKNYDLGLLTYKELDLSWYANIANSLHVDFTIEYFSKTYFSSVKGYNSLCLSKDLYLRFNHYAYMLIYQLDAWVFTDSLQEWCNRGYDYIGAPRYWNEQGKPIFAGIGNGGLSLRKVQYCLNLLCIPDNKIFLKPSKLYEQWKGRFLYEDKFKGKRLWLTLVYIAKLFGFRNTMSYYKKTTNEDLIFSTLASGAWHITSKLPKEKEGAEFAFEKFPHYLYSLIGDKLPFGCHAFEKWDYKSFWSKYIFI